MPTAKTLPRALTVEPPNTGVMELFQHGDPQLTGQNPAVSSTTNTPGAASEPGPVSGSEASEVLVNQTQLAEREERRIDLAHSPDSRKLSEVEKPLAGRHKWSDKQEPPGGVKKAKFTGAADSRRGQRVEPLPEAAEGDKEKITYYAAPAGAEAADSLQMKMRSIVRRRLGGRATSVSKSMVIDLAVRLTLRQLEDQGEESPFVQEVLTALAAENS